MDDKKFSYIIGIIQVIIWGLGFAALAFVIWLTMSIWSFVQATPYNDYPPPPETCTFPENEDRWGIREPNEEEVLTYGVGILVFEYLNNPARCSENRSEGITYDSPFGPVRFVMTVEISPTREDPTECVGCERVTLDVSGTPYMLFNTEPLDIPDADEPHKIILLPAMF